MTVSSSMKLVKGKSFTNATINDKNLTFISKAAVIGTPCVSIKVPAPPKKSSISGIRNDIEKNIDNLKNSPPKNALTITKIIGQNRSISEVQNVKNIYKSPVEDLKVQEANITKNLVNASNNEDEMILGF